MIKPDLIKRSFSGFYPNHKYDRVQAKTMALVNHCHARAIGLMMVMAGYFGILKQEVFYGFAEQFKNLTELEDAIRDYIEYYNQKRIKIKLKGLTPLEYRQLVLR